MQQTPLEHQAQKSLLRILPRVETALKKIFGGVSNELKEARPEGLSGSTRFLKKPHRTGARRKCGEQPPILARRLLRTSQ